MVVRSKEAGESHGKRSILPIYMRRQPKEFSKPQKVRLYFQLTDSQWSWVVRLNF